MINFNLIVAEFSLSQNAFHTHTLMDMCKDNTVAILERAQSDYLPIGVFETYQEANEFIKKHYDKFKILTVDKIVATKRVVSQVGMVQKIFNDNRGRNVLIKIDTEVIEFFNHDQYQRQQQWINEENERRTESGEELLNEEESRNDNFYWIDKDQWKSDRYETRQGRPDNWHYHMARKAWFTEEMADFINDNTQ